MKFKIRSFGKSDENRPLAIFSMLYLFYMELNKQLDRITEFALSLTEKMEGLDEDSLNRRQSLLLAYAKIANSIKALTGAMERPPTIAEVAEACGEDEQRVARFLRGDYKCVGPEMLPFGVSLEKCDRCEFAICRKKGNRLILPKRPGRLARGIMKDSGRPSKILKLSEKPSSLEALWLELSEPEREKLEAYLKSKPFVDICKMVYLKFFTLILALLRNGKLIKWGVNKFLKPIGYNALRIAQRYGSSRLMQELRWYYNFDWILQSLEAYKQCPEKLLGTKLEIIRWIKTMPDEDFASLFIIAPFKARTLKA